MINDIDSIELELKKIESLKKQLEQKKKELKKSEEQKKQEQINFHIAELKKLGYDMDKIIYQTTRDFEINYHKKNQPQKRVEKDIIHFCSYCFYEEYTDREGEDSCSNCGYVS